MVRRYPHFAALAGPAPAAEWDRPRPCDAEDVTHGCFDEEHSCERCCDLNKGPAGDNLCWAGWMTYQKCCGPASRRWAGCGWQRGADYWAHEYYSLTPPRLHSAAQCQQRCAEDPDCGGWTYFPKDWQPHACRLPLAAVLAMRRSCLLRQSLGEDVLPTPHRGVLWGPRDCRDPADPLGGCLVHGVDRLSLEMEISQGVADARACRSLCQQRDGCKAFAYFPADYAGDVDDSCIMPPAAYVFWHTRCLLKSHATHAEREWFVPMGNVVHGSRSCLVAAPWLQRRIEALEQAGKGELLPDVFLAVDGDYGRSHCSRSNPWRVDFDAEYEVFGVTMWLGDLASLQDRELRTYTVSLVAVRDGQELEVLCGQSSESSAARPLAVACGAGAVGGVRGLVVRADGRGAGGGLTPLALCEVEAVVEPVRCEAVIAEAVTIGAWERRVFPPGAARQLPASSSAGQACERYGGGLVAVEAKGGAAVCVEATCIPSTCLETFDARWQEFAAVSGLSLWDPNLEVAAERCDALGGDYYEVTVSVYGATADGSEPVPAIMHFGFCAPGDCGEDAAATIALRLAAGRGVVLEHLPPGTQVSIQNVRPFARWEDVKLDFLIAGFARSGTHSVQGNLALHPECHISEKELTFNWGSLPMRGQVHEYERYFATPPAASNSPAAAPRLRGGKGEGVALSPRLLRLLRKVPNLKLVIVLREPVEWLESLYNLRARGCRQDSHCAGEVPSIDQVILEGARFEDVRVEYAELAQSVEDALTHFPPDSGRLLVLEFELLRARPREFFDRLCDFLGISRFPANFSFTAHATDDRKAYTADGTKADLCSRPTALAALRQRLAARGEHRRLAELLARAGAPWVSSRLVLGKDHCD